MNQVSFPQVKAWERPIELGMLGNDLVGDCTIAAMYHLRMTQRSVAKAGSPLIVTTEQAIADYTAIPPAMIPTQTDANGNNPTDIGADCSDVIDYYRVKGIVLGRVTIDMQNVDMVKAAIDIFGGIYTGIVVPKSMADELDAGIDPTFAYIETDKPTDEGHCINFEGYGRDGAALDSWGKVYRAGWDFYLQWVDECYAIVTNDWIKAAGISPSGLDLKGLLADLKTI